MKVYWSAHISGKTLADCKKAAQQAYEEFMGDDLHNVTTFNEHIVVSPEVEETNGTGTIRVVLYAGTASAEFTMKALPSSEITVPLS